MNRFCSDPRGGGAWDGAKSGDRKNVHRAVLPFLTLSIIHFDSEVEGSMYFRNVDNIIHIHAVQRPKSTIGANCIHQTVFDGILIVSGYNDFCVKDGELSG